MKHLQVSHSLDHDECRLCGCFDGVAACMSGGRAACSRRRSCLDRDTGLYRDDGSVWEVPLAAEGDEEEGCSKCTCSGGHVVCRKEEGAEKCHRRKRSGGG